MAGAAYIRFAPLFDALEGALIDLVVMLAGRRADQFAEFVVEAFGAEIALFLGNPFLQPEVRFDDEFAHGVSPCSARFSRFHLTGAYPASVITAMSIWE